MGSGVTDLRLGDHVAVIRTGKSLGDPRFGAFQKYALASVASTAKLGPSTSLAGAAAAILNLAAVVSALSIHLGLERPPLTGGPEAKPGKILIFGGSSSCGGLAIKYAASAGYTVVTTSSPANRDFTASLGPAHIIDHTLPADQIVEELRAHGSYDKIFDTIGLPPVTDIIVEYLSSVGGGAYNTLIPLIGPEKPIPDTVERKFAPYSWAFDEDAHKDMAKWFYEEYVPKGLDSGLIVSTRQQAIEGGLANVQHALDLMGQGQVSGRKLIMDPWCRRHATTPRGGNVILYPQMGAI